MPRDLFGDVTRPSISIGNRKWYTLPLSLLSHSAIVLTLIAIPILAPAVMPEAFANDKMEYMPAITPPTPPLPPRPVRVDPTPPVGPSIPITAPTGFHPEVPRVEQPDDPDISIIGPVVPGSGEIVAPPPVVIKTPPPPVRVGGVVRTPIKTHSVDPVYPPIAQAARVQGIVIIEAVIAEDGRVSNARILRSIPLLDQAALEAVRRWQFTPSFLNGQPVPVIMTVTVNFMLGK